MIAFDPSSIPVMAEDDFYRTEITQPTIVVHPRSQKTIGAGPGNVGAFHVEHGWCVALYVPSDRVRSGAETIADDFDPHRSRRDPEARNKIGDLGAYVTVPPSVEETDAAVDGMRLRAWNLVQRWHDCRVTEETSIDAEGWR